MRNTSNIWYGAHILIQRPPDIPVFASTAWILLAQYAGERMSLARSCAACGPLHAKESLCRFWGDLSARGNDLGLERDIVAALAQLNDNEYAAAGYWLDGRWHPDAFSMASLLWWLQAGQNVVSAAFDLHERASRGSSSQYRRLKQGAAMALVAGLVIA